MRTLIALSALFTLSACDGGRASTLTGTWRAESVLVETEFDGDTFPDEGRTEEARTITGEQRGDHLVWWGMAGEVWEGNGGASLSGGFYLPIQGDPENPQAWADVSYEGELDAARGRANVSVRVDTSTKGDTEYADWTETWTMEGMRRLR